jgi:hypothetical protein
MKGAILTEGNGGAGSEVHGSPWNVRAKTYEKRLIMCFLTKQFELLDTIFRPKASVFVMYVNNLP